MNFSKDDKKIVSGCEDKVIKIWNSETFELIKSLEGALNTYLYLILIFNFIKDMMVE